MTDTITRDPEAPTGGHAAAHRPTPPRRPEILAPAGNEEMMRAAVENGADAVYFGLPWFNARLRAENFDPKDLPRLMAWLHERGVRGYVTLNTLVFCEELPDAERALVACSEAGVDAVLVQDLGVALLAQHAAPDLPVHASTQMTITSAESVAAIEALGLNLERIVAARETSRKELKTLRRGTSKDVEVFIHGALCVAYSGQCLTSEALGGRSANRGECAQACRLPYDLIVDGEQRPLGDVKYLLSPRDLCGFEDIGDLIDTGIVSFKIEGRLKTPEYVAATVRSYRNAVDQALAGYADGGTTSARPVLSRETERMLEMTFSRGFTGGYLHEIDHQAVVEGRFPKKRGTFLGRVVEVLRDGVVVALEGPLRPGDGVVFDSGHPEQDEEGGRVFELRDRTRRLESFDPATYKSAPPPPPPQPRGPRGPHSRQHAHTAPRSPGHVRPSRPPEIFLSFMRGALKLQRVHPGDRLWKTSDPHLDAELRRSFEGDKIHHTDPITIRVEGRVGAPLAITLTDADGHSARILDTEPATAAENRALDEDVLRAQLGRLGNTPFHLATLDLAMEGALMVPFSRLNELRRRAVAALIEARRADGTRRRTNPDALAAVRESLRGRTARRNAPPAEASPPALAVLCRTLEQVTAAVATGRVATIYTDFEDIRLHREVRALIPAGKGIEFVPSGLRIMKPGEAPILRKLLDIGADAILVRNLASAHVLRQERPDLPLYGDYPLNISNDLTAALLFADGLRRLTPSYDLNSVQLNDLLRNAPPEWFEVTVHQYMPMFHMEHCVFCRFLSDGTDFTNCGRPCETHSIALRDRRGYAHAVKADAGCRNTVYNAVAQSASEYIDELLARGVRRFRVEFLLESGAQVHEAIGLYADVLSGARSGHDLWRQLSASSKLGVTRGPLDHA